MKAASLRHFWIPGGCHRDKTPSFQGGDRKNFIATTMVDPSPATTLPIASIRRDAPQDIDLQQIFTLPMLRHLASLSRSGAYRARSRTRSWRDGDVQQPKGFAWSQGGPRTGWACAVEGRHVSSIWSGCWRDRRGAAFRPKQTAGARPAPGVRRSPRESCALCSVHIGQSARRLD